MGTENCKLLICGKSFIACAALEYLVDLFSITPYHFEIIAHPNGTDSGIDTWEPSLKKRACDLKLRIINSFSEIRLQEKDLVISLEYDKIIKMSELDGAQAYNIHFSNLPKYRGSLTSIWPIRNLDSQGGVTLHVIAPGVDDGPIVDQKHFSIPKFWTSFDLYRAYNFYGYELFKKNITNLLTTCVVTKAQDESLATTHKRKSMDFSIVQISDFLKPAESVCAYVRSLIFPPHQLPTFQNQKIVSCDVLLANRKVDHEVGIVVYQSQKRAIVACQDQYVRLCFENKPDL